MQRMLTAVGEALLSSSGSGGALVMWGRVSLQHALRREVKAAFQPSEAPSQGGLTYPGTCGSQTRPQDHLLTQWKQRPIQRPIQSHTGADSHQTIPVLNIRINTVPPLFKKQLL